MGTVIHIDFSRRAARDATRKADAPPADVVRLPGTANGPQQAVVRVLDGAFRDNVIFAALPEADGFRIYQYARGVGPAAVAQARPVTVAQVGAAFRQAVMLEGGEAALYTLGVKKVHIIVCDGVLETGRCLNHYQAGEAIMELRHGGIIYGPVEEILERLVPLDEEGHLSLKAMRNLLKARTGGPRLDM